MKMEEDFVEMQLTPDKLQMCEVQFDPLLPMCTHVTYTHGVVVGRMSAPLPRVPQAWAPSVCSSTPGHNCLFLASVESSPFYLFSCEWNHTACILLSSLF